MTFIKIVATNETRMNASRLPLKMLLPVNRQLIIGHLVQQLRQVLSLDEMVLATTTNPQGEALVQFAEEQDLDKTFKKVS